MKFFLVLLTVLTIGVLEGKDSHCIAKKIKGWTYNQAQLDHSLYVEFINDYNRHILSFIQWRAGKNRGPLLNARLVIPGAYGNFQDPLPSFLNIVINGIQFKDVYIEPEKIRVWNDAKTGYAGVDVPINFDGLILDFHWYMRPDSGVLFLDLGVNKNSLEKLKEGTIEVISCPSGLHLNKRGAIWDLKKYGRMAVSPARTYTQKTRKVKLQKDDCYLVLMDSTLPGTGDVKGVRKDHGPGVFLPDVEKTLETTLHFGAYTKIIMKLPENFSKMTLGFWQKKEIVTNDEVLKLVKEKPGMFRKK